jgi:competence protein ComEC
VPRSGWLALGATAAALLGGLGLHGLVVPILAAATLIGSLLATPRVRRVVVAVALGALLIGLRIAALPGPTGDPTPPSGAGPWSMTVEAIGPPRDGDQVATLRMLDTPPDQPALRLAATLPRYPPIQPGDLVLVGGRTEARPDSDYGRYLERIGVWGTLRGDGLSMMPAADGPAAALEDLRRAAGDRLAAVLPEPEAGLAAGILIGLRDRVDRDVATAFTTAGASHIVAISGWNIAIVAAAVAAIAGGLGRRRRSVVTALAITAYVAFAGASPSVLRAGAMAGVVLLARESGRAGQAAAALGWAAFLLLLADPAFAGDAGFQLSTLATAGLIAWATPTTALLQRWGRGRLPGWIAETLGVSLAAQLATLPIVVAAFGRIALVAPALNLVVVPLVAPVMAAGVLALTGGVLVGLGAPDVVGAVLALPAWVGLRLMIGLVAGGAAIPYASVEVAPPVGVLVAGALSAVIGALILARRRPARERSVARTMPAAGGAAGTSPAGPVRPSTHGRVSRLATSAVVVALVCTGAIAASRPAGVASVTVLDVGQGDAILLEGDRGGRLLVDGGPDPDRLLVELDRRIPAWDRRIDLLVLSHPHEDHVAGLALLLERYRVGRVLEPGMRGPGPGYAAWDAVLARPGAPPRGTILAGDRIRLDDISLDVLWPRPGSVPAAAPDSGSGINNVSVVLLGTVRDRRFLLTGDVEETVDPSLLAGGLPTVDLLKVAHHGSRTATTEAFVERVRPRVAVASAGTGNPYGHPVRSTLDRLAAVGADVRRTDRDGSIRITFGADGMRVQASGGRAAIPVPVGVAVAVGAGRSPLQGTRPGAFLCAIPDVPGLGGGESRLRAAPMAGGSEARSAAAPTIRHGPATAPGMPGGVGYHRADDGPHPGRGGCPAALPGSPTVVPRARAGRGRDCRLAGPPDGGSGHHGRPAGDRDGGPAPRRRQGPPAHRPCARAPAR